MCPWYIATCFSQWIKSALLNVWRNVNRQESGNVIIINLFTLTGATVVFAQFPISQFRAIAWFNVAVGLFFILLQLLLFRGESQCKKLPHFSFRCWSVRWTSSSVTCVDVVVSFKKCVYMCVCACVCVCTLYVCVTVWGWHVISSGVIELQCCGKVKY